MTKFTRLPFTFSMLVILIGLGVYGRTHVGPLDAGISHEVGFSPKLLIEGEVHRLITSLFFTAGGWMFYVSLAMFAITVGWTEWCYGTRRALTVFWGVHLTTLLIVAIAISLPLSALGSMHGNVLYGIRDVGPSAGYYGCLGYSLGGNARHRRLWITLVSVLLLVRLCWSGSQLPESGSHYTADLAHALAWAIGVSTHSHSDRQCH